MLPICLFLGENGEGQKAIVVVAFENVQTDLGTLPPRPPPPPSYTSL